MEPHSQQPEVVAGLDSREPQSWQNTDIHVPSQSTHEFLETTIAHPNRPSRNPDANNNIREERNDGAIWSYTGGDADERKGFELARTTPYLYVDEEMTKQLEDRNSFNPPFSFGCVHAQAPNPILDITGIGIIGLPLSTRDAEGIKSCAHPAGVKQGEHSLVDESAREAWAVNADQVRINSPDWEPFVRKSVQEVCKAMDVHSTASPFRYELHKLMLFEAGAHLLPNTDSNTDGAFATFLVILPCKFEGGVMHISHSGLSNIYDGSSTSLTRTTVLAWYTDATPVIEPIKSGHLLALLYTISHAPGSPRPSLLPQTDIVEKLRHILASWSNAPSSQGKVAILLDHLYFPPFLHSSVLKGVDARVVAVLSFVAKDLDISLGLGNLLCFESAEDGAWVSVEDVVDLEGQPICEDLDFSIDEREGIPSGDKFVQCMRKLGYTVHTNHGNEIDSRHFGTALMIWPSRKTHYFIQGRDGFNYACKIIRRSTSSKPTFGERKLVERMLREARSYGIVEAIETICAAAVSWTESLLWLHVVRRLGADQSLMAFNEVAVCTAITAFGFEVVRPVLETALEMEPKNPARLRFVADLQRWLQEVIPAESQHYTEWFIEQRSLVMETLRKPDANEYQFFVSHALEQVEFSILDQTFLEQVSRLMDPLALRDFAELMYREKNKFPAPEPYARTATEILLVAITKEHFYIQDESLPDPILRVGITADLPQAQRYVTVCLALDRLDYAERALSKLTEGIRDCDSSSAWSVVYAQRTVNVLLPLVVYLMDLECVRSSPAIVSQLRSLSEMSVKFYVDYLQRVPQIISNGCLTAIVLALNCTGNRQLLRSKVFPCVEELQFSCLRLRAGSGRLHTLLKIVETVPEARELATRLLDKYASEVALSTSLDVLDALEYCLWTGWTGEPDPCSVILYRAVDPPLMDAAYVTNVLAPLVPKLVSILQKYPAASSFPPIVHRALRRIMIEWIDMVLGAPPTDPSNTIASISRIPCTCKLCVDVRVFLTKQPERSFTFEKLSAGKRKHVTYYLKIYAGSFAVNWSVTQTRPRGLKITKMDFILNAVRWHANRNLGRDLVRHVSSDPEVLKVIFAEDYERIIRRLDENLVPDDEGLDSAPEPMGASRYGSHTPRTPTPISPQYILSSSSSPRYSIQSEDAPSTHTDPPRDAESSAVDSSHSQIIEAGSFRFLQPTPAPVLRPYESSKGPYPISRMKPDAPRPQRYTIDDNVVGLQFRYRGDPRPLTPPDPITGWRDPTLPPTPPPPTAKARKRSRFDFLPDWSLNT